jgi:hypothetical protein
MKIATAYRGMLVEAQRIDARFFTDRGATANLRIKQGPWGRIRLGSLVEDANIWAPPIFTRVYAADKRFGKPYLAPSDTLRYMPQSKSYLSRSQTKRYERYEVDPGWLVITCSGRNLGPSVYVDNFIAKFVLSHDMIRIASADQDSLFYVMAFLHTPTGLASIRHDRGGSVIDHINPNHVKNLVIPLVDSVTKEFCINGFKTAAGLRERARITLDDAARSFALLTGLAEIIASISASDYRRRWDIKPSTMNWRIDAEPYAPIYKSYHGIAKQTGFGCRLGDIAEISKPPGRYTTYYVDEEKYGMPILSGRQIAQHRPVGLKFISPFSFNDPASYKLDKDWIVMTADGRAEENLADCAVIGEDRAGWTASGHIFRIKPREAKRLGLVYLAYTAAIVQAQIKSLATGSVVDALSEQDVSSVWAVYPDLPLADTLGNQVEMAWRDFAQATQIENEAIQMLETVLS